MTVGELRRALTDVPDHRLVMVSNSRSCDTVTDAADDPLSILDDRDEVPAFFIWVADSFGKPIAT